MFEAGFPAGTVKHLGLDKVYEEGATMVDGGQEEI